MITEHPDEPRKEVAGASVVRLSDSTSFVSTTDRPRWLWPRRIPLGALTLLAGEPQAGKSYLTLDFAARVSNGSCWPAENANGQGQGADRHGPGSVMLACGEDSFRDTIGPRLAALGAERSKFQFLPFGEGHSLDMRMEMLRQNLYRLKDCRLIVIDPISVFLDELGGTAGRKLVNLLVECVRYQSTALVLVTHLRSSKGKALHLPSGSDALVRAARAVWLLANDPVDPDRRLFLPVKNNLARVTDGLAFKLEPVGDGEFARLQWDDEPVPMSADDFLSESARDQSPPRDHKLLQTVEWLREQLRDGQGLPAGEIQRLARTRGISYGTLRRAFVELGVESLPKNAEHPCRWLLKRPTTPT